MRSFIRDHIDSSRSISREICDRIQIEWLLVEHESGRQNHEKLLWTLVNLELFQERYRLGHPGSLAGEPAAVASVAPVAASWAARASHARR
jgi:asparagine synthase (glutamine-hydrolysing)